MAGKRSGVGKARWRGFLFEEYLCGERSMERNFERSPHRTIRDTIYLIADPDLGLWAHLGDSRPAPHPALLLRLVRLVEAHVRFRW